MNFNEAPERTSAQKPNFIYDYGQSIPQRSAIIFY